MSLKISDLDNAKTDLDYIAEVATSPEYEATDRFGQTKPTLSGAIYKISGVVNRGAWVSATAYIVKDIVVVSGTWYMCVVPHTSSAAFATDEASKWRIYQGVTSGDLDTDTGSELVGTSQAAPSAVKRSVRKKLNNTGYDLEDFDDSFSSGGDATNAFIKAFLELGEGGSFFVSPGVIYVVEDQQEVLYDSFTISSRAGYGIIKAADGSQFESILRVEGKSNFSIQGIVLDANQLGRFASQTTRYMGAAIIDCVSPELLRVIAKNTLGYASIPGVGLAFGGNTINGTMTFCAAENCGTLALPSDGFYTSGTNNLISRCRANLCTDTAFVVESSNQSGIENCIATDSSCIAAITNATNADVYDNYIRGLIGNGWSSAVTGGLQIGNPLSTSTGNLIDTVLTGISLRTETGVGPAVNVRQTGVAKTIGLDIVDVTIRGASTQGIVATGEKIRVINPKISGTSDACIQFVNGSDECSVTGGKLEGGSFGVISDGVDNVRCYRVNHDGLGVSAYSIYFFGTAVGCDAIETYSAGAVFGVVGSDVGTTPRVRTPYSTGDSYRKDAGVRVYPKSSGDILIIEGRVGGTVGLCSGNAVTATTFNGPYKAALVYDLDGNPLGYAQLANSIT